MLKALFVSEVRIKLLSLVLLGGEESWSVGLLARRTGAAVSQVRAELSRLEKAGVLVSDVVADLLVFRANGSCSILPELRSILVKTVGLGDELRVLLKPYSIKAAFIYGSMAAPFAVDFSSDIDVLLIGELSMQKVAPQLRKLQNSLGRVIQFSIFPVDEWKDKIHKHDKFVQNVVLGPKTWIVGDEDVLRGFASR